MFKKAMKASMYSICPRIINDIRLRYNRKKYRDYRCLEIGPGSEIIAGYERLNIKYDGVSDYVCNAVTLSSIPSNEFHHVYASHILEHIPWYNVPVALNNWNRILKSSGHLDIWVPDASKIAQAYLDAINHKNLDYKKDGWYRYNSDKCPSTWFNGRMFSYGDGSGKLDHPNWHRSAFDYAYLVALLKSSGFNKTQKLKSSEIKGHDHGWINLGIRAYKI